MNGLVIVDKPPGPTSHDVVARCRRALGERRIGHAGTLDPPATGVLVLGVGRATRLLRFLEAHDKEYVTEAVFGARTTTLDAEGQVLTSEDASGLRREQVDEVLAGFRGAIEQIPPMVSAVKVGGEPLYRKARRGEDVARVARPVVVHEAVLQHFEEGERARAGLRFVVSKGTYVRTLVADLGDRLSVGAHVVALRRVRVGPFPVDEAVALDDLSPEAVRPMQDAVAGYPRVDVDEAGARALVQGRPLRATGVAGPYAVFGPAGLVAMAEDRGGEARSLCVVAAG